MGQILGGHQSSTIWCTCAATPTTMTDGVKWGVMVRHGPMLNPGSSELKAMVIPPDASWFAQMTAGVCL